MEQEITGKNDSFGANLTVEGANGHFIKGESPSMKAVEGVIQELAQSDVPVLLLGESGSGKRTVARWIHETSGRNREEFRLIGCAGLTPEVFEQSSTGVLLGGGTVFLEEIGDLGSACQMKLLEALPGMENGHRRAHARLICGSAHDLEAEVRSGRFREDLYYRLSGVCLRLPPLRQRKEDISLLMSHFLSKYAHDFQRSAPALSPQTQQLFQDYAWPGNIRELEDAAKAIVALGNESVAMGGLRAMLMKADRSGNGEKVSLKQAARAASREAEKELILKVLNRTRWNRRRAAQELQISYKALLYKLKQIGYGEYSAS